MWIFVLVSLIFGSCSSSTSLWDRTSDYTTVFKQEESTPYSEGISFTPYGDYGFISKGVNESALIIFPNRTAQSLFNLLPYQDKNFASTVGKGYWNIDGTMLLITSISRNDLNYRTIVLDMIDKERPNVIKNFGSYNASRTFLKDVSPDFKYLAIGVDNTIDIWDIMAEKMSNTIKRDGIDLPFSFDTKGDLYVTENTVSTLYIKKEPVIVSKKTSCTSFVRFSEIAMEICGNILRIYNIKFSGGDISEFEFKKNITLVNAYTKMIALEGPALDEPTLLFSNQMGIQISTFSGNVAFGSLVRTIWIPIDSLNDVFYYPEYNEIWFAAQESGVWVTKLEKVQKAGIPTLEYQIQFTESPITATAATNDGKIFFIGGEEAPLRAYSGEKDNEGELLQTFKQNCSALLFLNDFLYCASTEGFFYYVDLKAVNLTATKSPVPSIPRRCNKIEHYRANNLDYLVACGVGSKDKYDGRCAFAKARNDASLKELNVTFGISTASLNSDGTQLLLTDYNTLNLTATYLYQVNPYGAHDNVPDFFQYPEGHPPKTSLFIDNSRFVMLDDLKKGSIFLNDSRNEALHLSITQAIKGSFGSYAKVFQNYIIATTDQNSLAVFAFNTSGLDINNRGEIKTIGTIFSFDIIYVGTEYWVYIATSYGIEVHKGIFQAENIRFYTKTPSDNLPSTTGARANTISTGTSSPQTFVNFTVTLEINKAEFREEQFVTTLGEVVGLSYSQAKTVIIVYQVSSSTSKKRANEYTIVLLSVDGLYSDAVFNALRNNSVDGFEVYNVTFGAPNGSPPNSDNNVVSETPDSRSSGVIIIIVIVIGGALLIGAIVAIVLFVIRRRRRNAGSAEDVQLEKVSPANSSNARRPTVRESGTKQLKDIKVGRKLGNGRFGDVYLGDWRGTEVALKVLVNREDIVAFERESEMFANVGTHPNIVTFFGMYKDKQGMSYIVLEYVAKGDLNSYLHEHFSKLTQDDLIDMVLSCARGMSHLSDQNIIHRDLAVRNLLVRKDDRNRYSVKVSDFGMSKAQGYYTVGAESVLPVRWSAPEVLKQNRYLPASDVWSFGVVVYEIFTGGRLPYNYLSNKQVAEQVPKGERLVKPDDCPVDFWSIIETCFELDPTKRPTFDVLLSKISDWANKSSSNGKIFDEPVVVFKNNNSEYQNVQKPEVANYNTLA